MTKFVRFCEVNDHEGEEWYFWLQLDGNEDELYGLEQLLTIEHPEGDLYSLHLGDEEPEETVDKLVEYAARGYYESHNKVTGRFVCPAYLGEDAERLYKGGICDFFREEAW